MPKKPLILAILDGWGIGPANYGNAISQAKLPFYTSCLKKYAYTELEASSKYVGLPLGQSGNSEAGHMNIGAGRIVEQDAVVISRSINDGTFFRNPAFLQAARQAKKHSSDVHLIGLLTGNQSAHSDPDHLISLITFFKHQNVKNVYLHLFTDGRDSPKYYAQKLIKKYGGFFNKYARVATIMGRLYGMDRKKEWSRTELAYNAMIFGEGIKDDSAEDAILHAYAREESDEFIKPTIICDKDGKPRGIIKDNDSVVFFNLRSDRARQMCKPFVQKRFEDLNKGAFKRRKILQGVYLVAMTDFGPDLGEIVTAYPSRDVTDTLQMVLHNYRQMAIAENEKYAHVTYFFNGGYSDPVAGEKRIIVESPHLKMYDKEPQMSLQKTTSLVVEAVKKNLYDFIVMNVANADMVAHTGNLFATIKACEYVDVALGKISSAVLEKKGILIVTADHGNAEELVNKNTGWPDTEHSTSRVPFIVVKGGAKPKLRKKGILGDIAPTILDLLHENKPQLMTGKSLIIKK